MPITLDAIAKTALALPEVTEGERHGMRTWFVGKKGFVWERPLRGTDLKRYGTETPPDGPIAAVRTEDLHAKEALLASGLPGFFTIPHFDLYPSVLIQLKKAKAADVREAIEDAWFACAPAKLLKLYSGRKLL